MQGAEEKIMYAVIESIDIVLLEGIYKWNEMIVLVLGISVSLAGIVFGLARKPIKKTAILFFVAILIITIFLGVGIVYAKRNYTYVPNINLTKESLEEVYAQLNAAGLRHEDEHIIFDEISEKHIRDREDLMNHAVKVTDCNPKPGEFVKKGTTVDMSVSWLNEIGTKNIKDFTMENFNAKEFYGNPDLSDLDAYNTLSIRILTLPAALKEEISNAERLIYVQPALEEESIVEVQVFDYATDEMADRAVGYLGDQITFPLIQPGAYYFSVSCAGYQTALSEYPFRLKDDDSEPQYEPCWYVPLEKAGDVFSSPFQICVQDKQGNPIPDITVSIYVDSQDGSSSATEHWVPSYVTDENGYLCGSEGNGGIVEFQILDGYFMNLFTTDDKTLFPVYPTGDNEIYVQIM